MKKILQQLLQTENALHLLVLRLIVAIAIFPHGAQKALGWWGGYGFEGTMGFFTSKLGIPYVFALLAIAAEFLAPLALVLGLTSRIAAFGIGFTIATAAFMAHIQNGFFIDWMNTQQGAHGIEYHILLAGASLAVVIGGAGRWSLDRLIARRL
ncbi:MAG: DoxX family protein [Candidatus Methylacidiphilales bacterium]|nr:DoxX family protein [Candidatus Methylacidiphilales bacterium]